MKRTFSIIFLIIIFIYASLVVFAAEEKVSLVKYDVDAVYEINIPAEIDLDVSGKGQFNLTIGDNFLLYPNSSLNVYISSDNYTNTWNLVHTEDATKKIAYTINDTIQNNDLILTVDATYGDASEQISKSLVFEVSDKVSFSGSYTDILTFNLEIVENE